MVDGKLLSVAGYGGADVNPAWVHNLRAHIEVATDSFDVVAHELDPSEREAIIPKINATTPAFAFANYPVKNHAHHPDIRAAGGRVMTDATDFKKLPFQG